MPKVCGHPRRLDCHLPNPLMRGWGGGVYACVFRMLPFFFFFLLTVLSDPLLLLLLAQAWV